MTGLLREVGRARRAVEQFTEAAERIEAFSARLEELPLMHAGDAFALLTGDSGVDAVLSRQLSRVASLSPPLPEKLRQNAPASGRWQAEARPTNAGTRVAVVGHALACPAPDSFSPSDGRGSAPVEPFSNSTTVLAQRFEQAGLKTAWETAFRTAAEPLPVSEPVTQTAGPPPGTTTTHSPQLLRTVERAERAGLARTQAQGSAGLSRRQIPMAAEDRESLPRRLLTPDEAKHLRAVTTAAPERRVASRAWPDAAVVTHDREWVAAADHDAVPRQRWVPPTGSGLRRLASLAGVLPGDFGREDPPSAPRAAGLPDREWPLRHFGAANGDADFVTRLEEALRGEAVRNGIDPEELIP